MDSGEKCFAVVPTCGKIALQVPPRPSRQLSMWCTQRHPPRPHIHAHRKAVNRMGNPYKMEVRNELCDLVHGLESKPTLASCTQCTHSSTICRGTIPKPNGDGFRRLVRRTLAGVQSMFIKTPRCKSRMHVQSSPRTIKNPRGSKVSCHVFATPNAEVRRRERDRVGHYVEHDLSIFVMLDDDDARAQHVTMKTVFRREHNFDAKQRPRQSEGHAIGLRGLSASRALCFSIILPSYGVLNMGIVLTL